MTETNINVVGFIILAALFYYFQIYRPKKLRANPEDLDVKKLSQQQLKLADIASNKFSSKYIVLNQMRFDDLFHSPSLSKNATFKKHMSSLKCDVILADKKTGLPILAIQLANNTDDEKQNYINGAGLGCLIFTHVDDEDEIVKIIAEAIMTIEKNDTVNGNLAPA